MTKQMEKKVNALVRNGAKVISNVTIKNINVTKEVNYVRVSLTLDEDIDGYVLNQETGEYELAKTNIVFTSTYAIASILKDNDETAFAANFIVNNPKALNVVLSRAKIDVLQEHVENGKEYVNPFTNSNNSVTFDHNTIINHIIDIKSISKIGYKAIDKIFDLLMQPEIAINNDSNLDF